MEEIGQAGGWRFCKFGLVDFVQFVLGLAVHMSGNTGCRCRAGYRLSPGATPGQVTISKSTDQGRSMWYWGQCNPAFLPQPPKKLPNSG